MIEYKTHKKLRRLLSSLSPNNIHSSFLSSLRKRAKSNETINKAYTSLCVELVLILEEMRKNKIDRGQLDFYFLLFRKLNRLSY